MNIQGPSGPPPVDNEAPVVINPGVASSATKSTAQAPSPSVQVQLSPSLFKQGQILQVVIAKVEQDALLLLMQNRLTDSKGEPLQVQFRVPPFPGAQQGQQLSVQVTDIKNNLPVLRLIASNPATPQDIINTLRQNLATTQPLQTVFDHLTAAKTAEPINTLLPNTIREQLDRLWRTLPEATTLQRADNLRQALKYAGPFLEAHLANVALGKERVFPAMDVRAQLLRLADALRQHMPQPTSTTPSTATPQPVTTSANPAIPMNTPQGESKNVVVMQSNTPLQDNQGKPQTTPQQGQVPNIPPRQVPQYDGLQMDKILQQLLQQTDAGLTRIQQQQLQMIPGELRPQWLLELPIKTATGVDVFDIRIQPDSDQKDNQSNDLHYPWTVMLAFNLDGLGPIRAQISLYQGRISSYWWVEQQQTVSLFQQHRGFLENRLSHAGVPFHKLVCEFGMPELKAAPAKMPYSNTNLDERV